MVQYLAKFEKYLQINLSIKGRVYGWCGLGQTPDSYLSIQSNVMSPKTDSQTPSLGGLCLGK